jgi:hypothetical protein
MKKGYIEKDYFISILEERFLLSFMEQNFKINVYTYGKTPNVINPKSKIDIKIFYFQIDFKRDNSELFNEIVDCLEFIKGFFYLSNYEHIYTDKSGLGIDDWEYYEDVNGWHPSESIFGVKCRFIY